MSVRSFLPSLWDRHSGSDLSFNALQREIDRVFNDFTRGHWPAAAEGRAWLSPRIDIKETEAAIEVAAGAAPSATATAPTDQQKGETRPWATRRS